MIPLLHCKRTTKRKPEKPDNFNIEDVMEMTVEQG